jgi:long-chain acyl-CoA synthetase
VFLDEQAIAKSLLDSEAKAEIPENIRLGANRQFPAYSQISKVEIMDRPFEKTPKMSIRRFLYK